jgi:hypothetical protein
MIELGFKKLTLENWLQPDPVSSMFGRIDDDGHAYPIEGDDWLRNILRPRLEEAVPIEVQRLFEVARGALAFGYFFYPLYTLAGEQLFRVAEAAVTRKCKEMKAPGSIKTFNAKLSYLIEHSVIPAQDKDSWDAIRNLRNIASHPERQSIVTPAMAIGMLASIADSISTLFPK